MTKRKCPCDHCEHPYTGCKFACSTLMLWDTKHPKHKFALECEKLEKIEQDTEHDIEAEFAPATTPYGEPTYARNVKSEEALARAQAARKKYYESHKNLISQRAKARYQKKKILKQMGLENICGLDGRIKHERPKKEEVDS